jgi:hypothetical protein
MEKQLPEPWLRGPIPGVSPLIAPVLYAFQQAREDLAKHTGGLTADQVWARPPGLGRWVSTYATSPGAWIV